MPLDRSGDPDGGAVERRRVEAIYRRLGPPIYRRCLKILRRPQEASDASQEVFVRILRHQDRLPPEKEQLRWAYAVATRICLNRLRDGAWENPVEGEELPGGEDLTARPSQTGDWLADKDLAVRLLEKHDEETRSIAWLVLVDGHTQEEAGELLGYSRKTVGKKLNAFLVAARRLVTAESA